MFDISDMQIVCRYPVPPEVIQFLNDRLLLSLGLKQNFLQDLERIFKKSLDRLLLKKLKYTSSSKLSKSFEEMIIEFNYSVIFDLEVNKESIKQASGFEKSVMIQNIIAKSIQSTLIDLREVKNV